jgi:L-threonylcarbamoyladenylate synthase
MSNTTMLKTSDERWLPEALEALRTGRLVAFPTDTVYGLGCDAFNAHAVERLYQCKGRGTEKSIPVLVASLDQIGMISLDPDATMTKLGKALWPGPLTIILAKHPSLPQAISSGSTLGVRIPDHPIALALLEAWGPMAVTSANLSGERNTVDAAEVLAQLDGRFDLLIDGGRSPGGAPSTVVDCTVRPYQILREGPIHLDRVMEILEDEV